MSVGDTGWACSCSGESEMQLESTNLLHGCEERGRIGGETDCEKELIYQSEGQRRARRERNPCVAGSQPTRPRTARTAQTSSS
ncbi:hypothetical protein CesoFtcFv8_021107 [Champsocephalus esox]|uniref:Uncharacterized protein n=2 Tax=Champsocephalus TaxID=52236 RepID=A0AAN8CST4_CHAGU|nr:hypothetical protein CesoFtcFv8_021107 [Champsocephalus esox]KAK5908590.1 hypothetical protein CgunFtcFv8_016633 [Champsocephalus gunnari]